MCHLFLRIYGTKLHRFPGSIPSGSYRSIPRSQRNFTIRRSFQGCFGLGTISSLQQQQQHQSKGYRRRKIFWNLSVQVEATKKVAAGTEIASKRKMLRRERNDVKQVPYTYWYHIRTTTPASVATGIRSFGRFGTQMTTPTMYTTHSTMTTTTQTPTIEKCTCRIVIYLPNVSSGKASRHVYEVSADVWHVTRWLSPPGFPRRNDNNIIEGTVKIAFLLFFLFVTSTS